MEMEQEIYESDAEEKGVLCETWDRLRRSLRITFVILIIIGILMDAIAIAFYTLIPNDYSLTFIGLGILSLCIPVVGICCISGIITFSRIYRSTDCPCPDCSLPQDIYNVPVRRNETYGRSNHGMRLSFPGHTEKIGENQLENQRPSSYDTTTIRDMEAPGYNSYARTDSLDYAVGCRPDTAKYQLESSTEDSEEEYAQCSNVRGYECRRNTQRKYPYNVNKSHLMGKRNTLDVRGFKKNEYCSRSRAEDSEEDAQCSNVKGYECRRNTQRKYPYNVNKLHLMGKRNTLDIRGFNKSEYCSRRSRREEENKIDQSMHQLKSIQPYKNRPRSRSLTRDYRSTTNKEMRDLSLSTRKLSQTSSRSNEKIESSMKDVEVTEYECKDKTKLSHMLRWQSDPDFSRRNTKRMVNENEETSLNKLRNMKNKRQISQCRETVEYSTPNSEVIKSPKNSEMVNFPINVIYWPYEHRQQLVSSPPSTERERFQRLSKFSPTAMNYPSENCKRNREYSSRSRENIQVILSERGIINTSETKITALSPKIKQAMRYPSPNSSKTKMILSSPTMEDARYPFKNSTFRKSFAPINKSSELHTPQFLKEVIDYSSFTNKDSTACLYRGDKESAHLLTSTAIRTPPCDLNAGLKPQEYVRRNSLKTADISSSSVRTKQTDKSTPEDSKVAYPLNVKNGQPYIWIERDQL